MNRFVDAVYALYSNAVRTEGDKAFDSNGNEITLNTININTWINSNAYKDNRAEAYPSLKDFMEAYTEKEIGGDSTKWDAYKTAYNKVRTDNPKG